MDGSTALTDPDGALTDPDAYIAMQFASTALSNPAIRSPILMVHSLGLMVFRHRDSCLSLLIIHRCGGFFFVV